MIQNLLIIGAGIYGLVAKEIAESMGCFLRIDFVDDGAKETPDGTPVIGTTKDFPSLFEGLPFALIEAQAAGIPCMISDTISTEVAITDLIHYESLQASPKVWAEHLDALPITRENTKQDLVTTGYDLDANAEFIVNFLQQ